MEPYDMQAGDVKSAFEAVLRELRGVPGFEAVAADPAPEPVPPAPPPPPPREVRRPAPAPAPAPALAPAPSLAREAARPAAARPCVLIVAADEGKRTSLAHALAELGIVAVAAADAPEGAEAARLASPDLIIAEVPPGADGEELAAELRAHPAVMGTPVSLFAAGAMSEEAVVEAARRLLGARLRSALEAPKADAPAPAAGAAHAAVALDEPEAEDSEPEALDAASSDSALVAEVNRILARAVDEGASDIHIEPEEGGMAVRFRVDGTLRLAANLPASARRRLAARVKVMARMVITERRLPQDGQIRAVIGGRKVEFRVSTVPAPHGEHIVLRVLGGAAVKDSLSELGMTARDLKCLERAAQAADGLILVTGPTGSGKSTTLYSLLNRLKGPDVKVVTAEDPIEHELKGVTQVAVRPSIGLTFERALRAFMRQDPDVILVGEIRDLETAEIAVKASITGHLVLSTLHTNSAAAAVARLTQMGVPPYLVASSVRLVVAQRLVRLLCEHCKRPAVPTDAERALLLPEESERGLRAAFQPGGCARCSNSGYKGRMPIFEVMPVESARLKDAIELGKSGEALHAIAASEGLTPLRDAALAAVMDGRTSFSEALPYLVGR